MDENKNKALTDEQLEEVSGGGHIDPKDILITSPAMEDCYRCSQCAFTCFTIDELNEHSLTHLTVERTRKIEPV